MTHTLYKLFPSRRFLLNFMSYTFNTVRILQRIPRFRVMSPEMETREGSYESYLEILRVDIQYHDAKKLPRARLCVLFKCKNEYERPVPN